MYTHTHVYNYLSLSFHNNSFNQFNKYLLSVYQLLSPSVSNRGASKTYQVVGL